MCSVIFLEATIKTVFVDDRVHFNHDNMPLLIALARVVRMIENAIILPG